PVPPRTRRRPPPPRPDERRVPRSCCPPLPRTRRNRTASAQEAPWRQPGEMTSLREYRQLRYARPPGAADLLLLRHGESAAAVLDEPFPMVDGHGDPALAPEGRAQAER